MYKRIVLKISGEALSGEQQGVTFFQPVVDELVRQIKVILQKGTQVSLVIGGGNFGVEEVQTLKWTEQKQTKLVCWQR